MRPFLVDTHCHLHFPPYEVDLEAVLGRMREKQMWGVTIGTALGNSERAIQFAEQHAGIWATVGLHPEHLTSTFQDPVEGGVDMAERTIDEARLERIARSSKKVVAIGETGLDVFRIDADLDLEEAKRRQEESFLAHLRVAQKTELPVVIHCRDALTRLAEMIQDENYRGHKVRGVVHSFTGTWDEAQPLIDLGLYIGVNGIATFPLRKTQKPEDAIDRTIERMPLEQIVFETDAPYLAPTPYRGKRNEPAWVEEIAKHVAKVRGMSLDEVAHATTENAMSLFRL